MLCHNGSLNREAEIACDVHSPTLSTHVCSQRRVYGNETEERGTRASLSLSLSTPPSPTSRESPRSRDEGLVKNNGIYILQCKYCKLFNSLFPQSPKGNMGRKYGRWRQGKLDDQYIETYNYTNAELPVSALEKGCSQRAHLQTRVSVTEGRGCRQSPH